MSATSTGLGRGRGIHYPSQGVIPGTSPLSSDCSGNQPRSSRTESENQKLNQSGNTPPRSAISDSSVNSESYKQLNVGASSFFPRGTQSQPAVAASQRLQDISTHMGNLSVQVSATVMVENIERILAVLLNNPSQFDRLAPELAKYLTETITSENQMFSSADVIFEWGLMEDNFSYTCSRICLYINSQINLNFNGTFGQHLFKRCHFEHKERSELLGKDPARLCRFATFISELYIKWIPNLVPIMKAIFELLELMLSKISYQFAKCVTQVLKMAGACLEDGLIIEDGNHNKMDNIIRLVTALCAKPNANNVSPAVSNMLMSVVTLRSSKWGRTISPATSQSRSPLFGSASQEYLLEPVFYSSTGQQISRAQAGFGDMSAEYDRFSTTSSFERGDAHLNGPQVSATTSDSSLYEPRVFSDSAAEDDADDELDIYVVDDDDETMLEEMWEDFRQFEIERLQEHS